MHKRIVSIQSQRWPELQSRATAIVFIRKAKRQLSKPFLDVVIEGPDVKRKLIDDLVNEFDAEPM